MGQMILKVVGSTVGTVEFPKDVSGADSERLVRAYAYSYREKWKDENGEYRQPSIEEVLQAWWDGVVAGSVAHVLSVEKELASRTAAEGVSAISVV